MDVITFYKKFKTICKAKIWDTISFPMLYPNMCIYWQAGIHFYVVVCFFLHLLAYARNTFSTCDAIFSMWCLRCNIHCVMPCRKKWCFSPTNNTQIQHIYNCNIYLLQTWSFRMPWNYVKCNIFHFLFGWIAMLCVHELR